MREDLRGTYAGLASEAALEYLTELGVTAVELLPIHHIADEQPLAAKGLTNYWGYSSIGYLAPARRLRGDRPTRRAGARVQGDGQGAPPRRDRGDPRRRLQPHRRGQPPRADALVQGDRQPLLLPHVPDDPRFYMDYTGTGNSLNPVHPSVLRLIMDSLRYFVIECHVDGFRFDLASALAREFHEVDRLSAFFDIIHQDPILSQVKLIAEPWDVGEGGYQVGNFPVLWTEWNGIYRDTMRDFWRGEAAVGRVRLALHRLERPLPARRPPAVRLDQLRHRPRRLHAARPRLLQREAQRGEPRGRTATARTTTAAGTAASRARPTTRRSTSCASASMRNFLATLFLSQGVPMLLGGDEFARTQRGNNNAYCQDNELSWFDWELDERAAAAARVHAAADRLPPPAPGLPARRLPDAARSGSARARRTSGGSGRTGAR